MGFSKKKKGEKLSYVQMDATTPNMLGVFSLFASS